MPNHTKHPLKGARLLIGVLFLGLAFILFWRFGWYPLKQVIQEQHALREQFNRLPLPPKKQANVDSYEADMQKLVAETDTVLSTVQSTIKPVPSTLITGEEANKLRLVTIQLSFIGSFQSLKTFVQRLKATYPASAITALHVESNTPQTLEHNESPILLGKTTIQLLIKQETITPL